MHSNGAGIESVRTRLQIWKIRGDKRTHAMDQFWPKLLWNWMLEAEMLERNSLPFSKASMHEKEAGAKEHLQFYMVFP